MFYWDPVRGCENGNPSGKSSQHANQQNNHHEQQNQSPSYPQGRRERPRWGQGNSYQGRSRNFNNSNPAYGYGEEPQRHIPYTNPLLAGDEARATSSNTSSSNTSPNNKVNGNFPTSGQSHSNGQSDDLAALVNLTNNVDLNAFNFNPKAKAF